MRILQRPGRVMAVATLAYGAGFGVQARWAPTLLVGTGPGLQTVLQTLPATFVALLALGFGGLFVAVQQSAQTVGTRAALLLVRDGRVVSTVLLTVALTSATVLIAGQVPPDGGSACEAVTAAAGTLMFGSVGLVLIYVAIIPRLLRDYTTPERVVDLLVGDLARADTAAASLVEPLATLHEAARHAVERHDADVFAQCATGALDRLRAINDNDTASANLLGHHLADTAVLAWAGRVGEPERTELTRRLRDALTECLRAGADDGATDILHALARTGSSATTGLLDDPISAATAFAQVEAEAEAANRDALAAEALALWATAVAHAGRLGDDLRVRAVECRDAMGPQPPVEQAITVVTSARWRAWWHDISGPGMETALDEIRLDGHGCQ